MRIFLFILFFPPLVSGQSLSRVLLKANSVYFRNNIYAFGFIQDKNDLHFKIFKASADLTRIDSTSNSLGKEKAENLLEITADTLHGNLNFYFQKANNKNTATLLRYNDSLRLIAKAENFESSKINSLTTFENEIYTYKNSTYTIRTSEDSLGKQFYLTKYQVISNQKPYEYKQAWQYPLEKRNINTAHVFYADDNTVLMYITILSGDRKGQWILKLNSQNGTMVKGIKLNANGDDRNYILSSFYYDTKEKELLVAGNIYTKQQLDLETKTFTLTGLNKESTFFFIKIDANNEVASRDQKVIPVVVISPPVKTTIKPVAPPIYHVRIKELRKVSKTGYEMYCNIYKSTAGSLLFLYESGFVADVNLEEMGIEITSGKIYNPIALFPNLINSDVKDINGKIELKSITEFDKFLYRQPVADIEKQFKRDVNKNTKWIICKSDFKIGTNYFYEVFLGLKGMENKLILQSSKYNNPAVYKTKSDALVIFNFNPENSSINLSVKNW